MNKIQPRVPVAPHLNFVENAARQKWKVKAHQKRRKAQISKAVYISNNNTCMTII